MIDRLTVGSLERLYPPGLETGFRRMMNSSTPGGNVPPKVTFLLLAGKRSRGKDPSSKGF